MGPLDLLLHLLNFIAPALVTGTALALWARFVLRARTAKLSLQAQIAINSVAGVAVLVAGLWYFGRDGKMATYAALVVACGLSQWLAGRHWR
ncbi:MAG: hypothetical protein AB7P37_08600 [Ramlibacter sp.]